MIQFRSLIKCGFKLIILIVISNVVLAQDLRIRAVNVSADGNVAIEYSSDANGWFTLLHGHTVEEITTPLQSSVGIQGAAHFRLIKPSTEIAGFFRIKREDLLAIHAFISAPTDGTTLSSEGSQSDPGAAEWNDHKIEEGDPGPSQFTPEQEIWLRQPPLHARTISGNRNVYDNLPVISDGGVSWFINLTRSIDLAYRESYETGELQGFEEATSAFIVSLSAYLSTPAARDPFSLILQTSRSMTPNRRVKFLSEVGKQFPGMRDLMQATLWRLAIQERDDAGWGYSEALSPARPSSIRSAYLTLGVFEPVIDGPFRIRGRLSYGPEFREIAIALLTATEDQEVKLNLLNFLVDLSGVAVPEGAICTHILGGGVADVQFEPLVRPELWLDGTSQFWRVVIQFMNSKIVQAGVNATTDSRLTRLEERVARLEDRVNAIEQWIRTTDTRLVGLEQAVAILTDRVNALESWRDEVEDRLSEIELRVELIETLGVQTSGLSLPKREDRDGDGIDDRVERLLIDAYSPVFMIENDWRPPVSVEWFIQHSFLRGPGENPEVGDRQYRSEWLRRRNVWKYDPYSFIPEYERLVKRAKEQYPMVDGIAGSFRLQLEREEFRDGESDIGDRMTWERAKREGNIGMYAHVVRGLNAGEYIVQYYMLLTWNETAYSFGIGNHEGDWLAVTLFIDLPEYSPQGVEHAEVLLQPEEFRTVLEVLESESRIDRIITARVCNHGRYIDTRGDKVEILNVGAELGPLRGGAKPKFWMEGGGNELWPNRGGRGYSGWPGVGGSGPDGPASISEHLTPLDSPLNASSENNPNYRDGQVFRGADVPLFGFGPKFRPPWILHGQGYRVSYDFGPGTDSFGLNEHKVVRGHNGSKGAYVTRSIPNLGEVTKEFSKSAELVLRYRGLWGGWWKVNASPEGPWKEEMWIDNNFNTNRRNAEVDPEMRRIFRP